VDLAELNAIAQRELLALKLEGWTFSFANTRRRLGVCKHRNKQIQISAFYAQNNSNDAVLDTLRHEFAHALAGPGAGHGPRWKAWAIRLGAMPRACDSSPHTVLEPGDWQATCPACGFVFHLYRQPRALRGYRCRCAARPPLTFEYRGDPANQPPPLAPEAQARWEAICPACTKVHLRMRRPKAGKWTCRCNGRGELRWQFRQNA
jgi:hypothetical protein